MTGQGLTESLGGSWTSGLQQVRISTLVNDTSEQSPTQRLPRGSVGPTRFNSNLSGSGSHFLTRFLTRKRLPFCFVVYRLFPFSTAWVLYLFNIILHVRFFSSYHPNIRFYYILSNYFNVPRNFALHFLNFAPIVLFYSLKINVF